MPSLTTLKIGGALNVVSGTVVHPELLHRHAQRDDVEQSGDPTVQRVLLESCFNIVCKFILTLVSFALVEGNIFNESDAVRVEEYTHYRQL